MKCARIPWKSHDKENESSNAFSRSGSAPSLEVDTSLPIDCYEEPKNYGMPVRNEPKLHSTHTDSCGAVVANAAVVIRARIVFV